MHDWILVEIGYGKDETLKVRTRGTMASRFEEGLDSRVAAGRAGPLVARKSSDLYCMP